MVQCASPPVQQADVEDSHVFMPSFPLIRYLPKWAVSNSSIDKESTSCSKYFNSHSGLTPGVFTFFCPHDVCIDFKLMHKHEGPSTLHDTLFTRLDKGTCCFKTAIDGSCYELLIINLSICRSSSYHLRQRRQLAQVLCATHTQLHG